MHTLGRTGGFAQFAERGWALLPLNVAFGYAVGFVSGAVLSRAGVADKRYGALLLAVSGVGSVGTIPIVFVHALCTDGSAVQDWFGGDSAECTSQGLAMAIFGSWMGSLVNWTGTSELLRPRGSDYAQINEDAVEMQAVAKQQPRDGAAEPPAEPAPAERTWLVTLRNVATQPTAMGIVLGMALGSGWARELLFDGGALAPIGDALGSLGAAFVPCMLLCTGGSLSRGPGPGAAKLGWATVASVCAVRLLVVPGVGLGVAIALQRLNLFPTGAKMLLFVLLLHNTVPTSATVGTVAILHKLAEEEVMALIFFVWVAYIPAAAAWLTLYLHFCESAGA